MWYVTIWYDVSQKWHGLIRMWHQTFLCSAIWLWCDGIWCNVLWKSPGLIWEWYDGGLLVMCVMQVWPVWNGCDISKWFFMLYGRDISIDRSVMCMMWKCYSVMPYESDVTWFGCDMGMICLRWAWYGSGIVWYIKKWCVFMWGWHGCGVRDVNVVWWTFNMMQCESDVR